MDADYFLPLRLEDTENLDGEWTLIKRKELRLDIGKPSAYFIVCPGNPETRWPIAAQLPTKHWHETIGDPTLADAILDRLIHNAYTIILKGESMRKRKKRDLTVATQSGTKAKDN